MQKWDSGDLTVGQGAKLGLTRIRFPDTFLETLEAQTMTMFSRSYSNAQSFVLGDKVAIMVNGNLRSMEVVGITADRKNFLFANRTFGPESL